ncbi:MAG: hypothetical protein LBP21_11390 [Synergistaceae bacterium]|jgi:hypothetical protein|nr:hypothetical protein [Synergistaceae bacterium]
MVVRKNVKSQVTAILEVPSNSDLPSRIEKISEQTGVGTLDLFQKWVLQEESLIGLIRRGRGQAANRTATYPDTSPQQDSGDRKQEKAAEIDPDSPNYRKTLIQRAKMLKKGGMTLLQIGELFNEENLPTMSGKGKWHPSTIATLLEAKK